MNYKMKDDFVDLSELYDFREKMELPHRTRDKREYSEYREKYKSLTEEVPDIPGWYIWYNSKNKEVIYVGKSTQLKTRLRKSLEDEYHIFWMKSIGDTYIINKMKNHYDKKYNGKIEREADKYGADKIFWISLEGLMDTLSIVEMKLINKFQDKGKEPRANTVIKDCRKIDLPLFEEVEKIVEKHCKKV